MCDPGTPVIRSMVFPMDMKLPFTIAEGAERTVGKELSESPHSAFQSAFPGLRMQPTLPKVWS